MFSARSLRPTSFSIVSSDSAYPSTNVTWSAMLYGIFWRRGERACSASDCSAEATETTSSLGLVPFAYIAILPSCTNRWMN